MATTLFSYWLSQFDYNGGVFMKSRVVKRSIVVNGHKTSVSLEDEFWSALKVIAGKRLMNLSDLVTAIDGQRQHGNLHPRFGSSCSTSIEVGLPMLRVSSALTRWYWRLGPWPNSARSSFRSNQGPDTAFTHSKGKLSQQRHHNIVEENGPPRAPTPAAGLSFVASNACR